MTLVLKHPTQMYPPNGGFSFVEPKTGMRFDGMHGSPATTAQKIAEHRRANPNLFPPNESSLFDIASIVQEIYQQKNATMPELFVGSPDPVFKFVESPKANVSGYCNCGANDWEEILCGSCSGRRVIGYKCRKCGRNK